jgi:hypothetical protein
MSKMPSCQQLKCGDTGAQEDSFYQTKEYLKATKRKQFENKQKCREEKFRIDCEGD